MFTIVYMNIKEYILSNSIFQPSKIAEKIGWNKQSMSNWLNGNRPIPEKHKKELEKLLSKYGFKNDRNG